jgi:hypothetical protein
MHMLLSGDLKMNGEKYESARYLNIFSLVLLANR